MWSVNHTHFPKEGHLPHWARRDNQVKKNDRVDCVFFYVTGQNEYADSKKATSSYLNYVEMLPPSPMNNKK